MAKQVDTFADFYRWMQGTFSKGVPYKLVAQHQSPEAMGPVDSWDDFQRMSPAEVADQIIERCEDDAKIFRGVQTYVVFCFRKERSDPSGRFAFRIMGREGQDGIEGESEPPTEKGHAGQMMRHNEALMRLMLKTMTDMIGQNQRAMERTQSMNEQFANKHFEVLTLVEQLVDRKAEREVKIEKEKNSEAFRKSLMSKVDLILPTVGSKLLPENKGIQDAAIASFLDSLSDEQTDKLMRALRPEQIPILIKILKNRGKNPEDVARLISSLDDGQMGALMQILSPEQMGVLSEYYQKASNGAARA